MSFVGNHRNGTGKVESIHGFPNQTQSLGSLQSVGSAPYGGSCAGDPSTPNNTSRFAFFRVIRSNFFLHSRKDMISDEHLPKTVKPRIEVLIIKDSICHYFQSRASYPYEVSLQ